MKKYLIFTFVALLLTGCGSKKLTCTLKTEEDDYKLEQKVIFKSKGDKVDNVEINYTMIFETEDIANDYFNIMNSLEEENDIILDKNKITIKSIKDYSSYEETKKELKEELESNGYTCK